MKKALIVVIIIIAILAIAYGVYTKNGGSLSSFFHKKPTPSPIITPTPALTGNESPSPTPTPATTESTLEKEKFSITIPVGWQEVEAIQGALAIVRNSGEEITDSGAKAINFKSYYSVSQDALLGKTEEKYLKSIKDSLSQTFSYVSFSEEKQITINNRTARSVESELSQLGIVFKVLVVAIRGNDENMWVVTFNTPKINWEGYKDLFYQVANSFKLK